MKVTYLENKKNGSVPGIPDWIRKLVLAWLAAAALEYLRLPAALWNLQGLEGLAEMSMLRMLTTAGIIFLLLAIGGRMIPAIAERWMILLAVAVMTVAAAVSSFTWPFLAASILVLGLLGCYAVKGWQWAGIRAGARKPEKGKWYYLAAALALVFFGLVSLWTVARVRSFSTPTYDFGIFAQMFHSMRTTGLPITTVERDGALSHFAVHVSPIYYLMLPFYCIVPRPETLQVLQAAVLASAVIPLWLLGKHHGLSQPVRALLCGLLLVYPAYAGGASYDIHENCFLTPLLLWLFYGLDRRDSVCTGIAALLTLMVKEDAAVYVAVVGLYGVLRGLLRKERKWDFRAGIFLAAGAVCWFALVTGYLAKFGDGVMTYRYKNFMYDGSGSLVTVIKAVLLCPVKAVFECVDPEKLKFIALTLLPLGALPLITRRYERYVLLIPYLLVNLMSDYRYQHDIFFQYTYGSTGCLIYLTLVNLADIRINRQRLVALITALTIGLGCFVGQIMPKVTRYSGYLVTYEGYYDSIRNVLDVIPEGASVASTTFYTTYLSKREILYDVRYSSLEHMLGCEYVAVGVTDANSLKKFAVNGEKGYENLVELLTLEGYVKIAEHKGRLEIYQKQE